MLVDVLDGQGHTSLHLAVANGYAECVMKLIELGANVNAADFLVS